MTSDKVEREWQRISEIRRS